MFYDNLIAICDKSGEKPSNVLRGIGISVGNLDKWRKGATVNSDILLKLSLHFGVSVDYLLTGKEKTPIMELNQEEQECLKIFKSLQPDDQLLAIGFMTGLAIKDTPESKENVS